MTSGTVSALQSDILNTYYADNGKFLEWFADCGNRAEINGKTWEAWNENKATRDSSTVHGKIDYIVALMELYSKEIQKAA